MSDKSRRRHIPLVLAIIALIGLVGVAFPVADLVKDVRNERRSAATKGRLEQIGLALHAYHSDYRSFHPAFVIGPDGRPWHSWRVLLLPYLDEHEVAASYRMDEPWDSPTNRHLVPKCPEMFQLPSSEIRPGFANVCAIIGRRTSWPAHQSLRFRDFLKGTSNSIHVVESPPRHEWTNPIDLNVREFLRDRQSLPEGSSSWVVFADGSARQLPKDFAGIRLANALAPRGRQLTFRGDDWPAEFVDASTIQWRDPVDSSTLPHTTLHASWDENLDAGKNNLWCAVFQLCWDRLVTVIGEPVEVSQRQKQVDLLNESPFDRTALDPSTYILTTGSANQRSTDELRDGLSVLMPELKPDLTELPGPNPSLRLFAALKKSIRYHDQLEATRDPLPFKSPAERTPVKAFGKEPTGHGLGEIVLAETVYVGDYVSDDDFVIMLGTEGGRDDQVILALMEPESSLHKCWERVANRLKAPHRNRVAASLRDGESLLRVPVLDFHVRHDFQQLIGLNVRNMPAPPPNVIKAAQETIAYRLDERGAELLAQAEIVVMLSSMGDDEPPFDPQRPRHFVLDRPFLLAMRETGASQLYLLCWVAMPDIMERALTAARAITN